LRRIWWRANEEVTYTAHSGLSQEIVGTVDVMPPKHPKAAVFVRSHLFENLDYFRDLEVRIEAIPTVGVQNFL